MRKQRRPYSISLIILVAVLLGTSLPSTTLAATQPAGVPQAATPAEVSGFIDGDKFKVRIDGKIAEVNLIGADAPESGKGDNLGECYAKEASTRMQSLIKMNEIVYLEMDKKDRDGKDRLLRYVWVPGKDGAKALLLNTKMVRDGYASFKSKDPNTKYDTNLAQAEDYAKQHNRGLWKACGGPHVKVTPPPALGTADNPAPVGGSVSGDGRTLTLENAYFVDAYDFLAPEPGNIFLTVEFIVKNTSESGKTHDYNELCFSATDPINGYKFDDTFLNPSAQPLGSGKLGPGDIARGEVVLEVRADSQQIRVKYDTGCGIGGKNLYWIVTR